MYFLCHHSTPPVPSWPHACDTVDCFLHGRLQDISSGYWVLVLHFTRREAVRQIDELQHIATNLGRSNPPLSRSQNIFTCALLGGGSKL